MTLAEPRLPRFTGWLRPLVDAAARIKASVHLKLLFGFLVGALLLVALAVLSLVVIGRMNDRVRDLDQLQEKASRAQQMLYAVTAQSHYRAMALLTNDDPLDPRKLRVLACRRLRLRVDAVGLHGRDRAAGGERPVHAASARSYATAGDPPGPQSSTRAEHPISHVLEASLRSMAVGGQQMTTAACSTLTGRC
jgi:hypothetical protein